MMERNLERIMFASRWLMAPFYFGLIIALALLLVKFVQELFHIIPIIFTLTESETILGILSLIDLSLAGALMLIVIFSGYENFVSKIHVDNHEDKPDWMGKVDFSGLKLKLIASIVAISGIQLLKQFMDIDNVPKENLMWLVIVHLAFVVSGVLLALMDYMTAKAHRLYGQH
ncbi:TIGR00645 family protein [Iodidimonas sp. SYSU 1G8]|uniref:TIGR00645 family protein n=1 Tax=Iodidimonas sp. SYSU 1G8 TaxID=3133967 RepID=UPI0031FE4E87